MATMLSGSHLASVGSIWRRSLSAVVALVACSFIAAGCSDGYDVPAREGYVPSGDTKCLADDEPGQGDPCSQDCLTASCASGMGKRMCTCESGVFVQCACLPPDNWPYKEVPAAPFCDRLTGIPSKLIGERCSVEGQQCRSSNFPEEGCTCTGGIWNCGASAGLSAAAVECEAQGSGLQAILKNDPCDQEWQVCIARDFNPTGTSPRGCLCRRSGAALEWYCGSTNRWWRAE
jgi:hypothetical protein